MLKKLFKIILSMTFIFSAWSVPVATYAKLGENVFLTSDEPVVDTDCMDSTNYMQDLEHFVNNLRDGMSKICALSVMNSCASSTDHALLVKYRQDVENLHQDLKNIMVSTLDRTCIDQKKK